MQTLPEGSKEKSQQADKPLSWISKDEEGFAWQRQERGIPAKGTRGVSCAASARRSEVLQAGVRLG